MFRCEKCFESFTYKTCNMKLGMFKILHLTTLPLIFLFYFKIVVCKIQFFSLIYIFGKNKFQLNDKDN